MRSASETGSPCRSAGASARARSLSVSTRPLRSSAMTGSGMPAITASSGSPARSATCDRRHQSRFFRAGAHGQEARTARSRRSPQPRNRRREHRPIANPANTIAAVKDNQAQTAPSVPCSAALSSLEAHRQASWPCATARTDALLDQVRSGFFPHQFRSCCAAAPSPGAPIAARRGRAGPRACRGSPAR